MRLTIILIGMILLNNQADGQTLLTHRWKNRILVISTPNNSVELANKQIAWLSEDTIGLKERKLIIYQTKPGLYKKGISARQWKESKDLYSRYHQLHQNFTVTLIGLDGDVKHKQTEPISLKELYRIIDAMPMRQSEIGRQKKKN